MPECRACSAEIKFITTKAGKQMPAELPAITVVTEDGRIIKAYRPHWQNCPAVNQFRRSKKK